MITDDFDERTIANMEVALDRACEQFPKQLATHEARKRIAAQILEKRQNGASGRLKGLTDAAIGGFSSLESHPAAFDFERIFHDRCYGVVAASGHSNSRSSRPSPAGDIRASIIRVWHFEQRGGRSIALSGNIVGVLPVMMRYKISGAGTTTSQSPVDASDRTAMANRTKYDTAKSVR